MGHAGAMRMPPAVGIGMLAVWLLATAAAFRAEFADAPVAGAAEKAAGLEHWYRQQFPEAAATGRAAVVYVGAACACRQPDATELERQRRRWAQSSAGFVSVDAAVALAAGDSLQTLRDYDVLVFSAAGQLAYAGAWNSGSACGGGGVSVALALQGLQASTVVTTAVLKPQRCKCSADRSV